MATLLVKIECIDTSIISKPNKMKKIIKKIINKIISKQFTWMSVRICNPALQAIDSIGQVDSSWINKLRFTHG